MNKTLIISVLLAVLIIGGAVMFVKKGDTNGEPDMPDMGFVDNKIIVPEFYQTCAQGDRCIVMDSHCGFCCEYTVINARFEKEFDRSFNKSCRRFVGSYCSCFDLSSYPACQNGKCQLVAWPEGNSGQPAQTQSAVPTAPQPEPTPYTPPPSYQPEPTRAPAPTYIPEPMPEPQPIPQPIPGPSQQEQSDQFSAPPYQAQQQQTFDPPSQEQDDFGDDKYESDVTDDDLFAPLPSRLPNDYRPAPSPSYGDDPLNRPLPSGNF